MNDYWIQGGMRTLFPDYERTQPFRLFFPDLSVFAMDEYITPSTHWKAGRRGRDQNFGTEKSWRKRELEAVLYREVVWFLTVIRINQVCEICETEFVKGDKMFRPDIQYGKVKIHGWRICEECMGHLSDLPAAEGRPKPNDADTGTV